MQKKDFNIWLSKLEKAWEGRNPQAAVNLFTEKVKYYETPFEKPHTSPKAILKLWSEVPSLQKNIDFKYQIISFSKNIGIANWTAKFTRIQSGRKAHLDGIFLVKLNKKGLSTYFKQWWLSKET